MYFSFRSCFKNSQYFADDMPSLSPPSRRDEENQFDDSYRELSDHPGPAAKSLIPVQGEGSEPGGLGSRERGSHHHRVSSRPQESPQPHARCILCFTASHLKGRSKTRHTSLLSEPEMQMYLTHWVSQIQTLQLQPPVDLFSHRIVSFKALRSHWALPVRRDPWSSQRWALILCSSAGKNLVNLMETFWDMSSPVSSCMGEVRRSAAQSHVSECSQVQAYKVRRLNEETAQCLLHRHHDPPLFTHWPAVRAEHDIGFHVLFIHVLIGLFELLKPSTGCF